MDFDIEASRAVKPSFYIAPTPEGMKPKQYQLAGVEYVLARDHALIGDSPGLGKSAEAIMISNAIQANRTLVVCPASLRLNWEREIWMWSTIPNVSTYPVLKSKDGISPTADYVIISYDLLRNKSIFNAILDLRWDHLILDEAHYLKDPHGNQRTRVICAPDCLPSVTGRITMLTGTILPNQPIECYNAIRLLNWEAINCQSLQSFREYYYGIGSGMIRGLAYDATTQTSSFKLHWSDNVRNVPRNLAELQDRLRKNIMVRRLKEQVLHELPKKQWHPFPLEITSQIKQALDHPGWKKVEKLYELNDHTFDIGIPIDGAISTARRLLGEAKVSSVLAYIKQLISEGVNKLVVAAWHHSVLDYLYENLTSYNLVYMDGSTSPANKQKAVDKFQNDDRVKIILGQMLPLGEGWTLSIAQDVVLVEPDWVPGKNDQLLDRIHRIGQKGNHVIGHIPIVPGTLDERILGTAIKKDQNIYKALDKH